MPEAWQPLKQTEAQSRTALGQVELATRIWDRAVDITGYDAGSHLLRLSLLPAPRDARCRFTERWSAQRFEPIGPLILVPAGEPIHAKAGYWQRERLIACRFRAETIGTWLDGEFEWTDSRLQAALDVANPAIHSLMLRLQRELTQPGFASETLMELLMGSLAIELARHCWGVTETRTSGCLSPWRLRLIDERLRQWPSPALSELAGLCGLSTRQLARGFHASRGLSLGRHIAESRVSLAKQLLNSDDTIKTISESLGFKSPSNFTTAFLRATGETPQAYRRRMGVED